MKIKVERTVALAFACLLPMLPLGCAMVSIRNLDGDKRTTATAYVPAWPWQDSQQIVDRLTVSARTNGAFSASLRASESEVTNTNLVSTVVNAAVGAAVRASKP